jgi:hypothetical protein
VEEGEITLCYIVPLIIISTSPDEWSSCGVSSSSYISPPWLGAVKIFSPTFPITFPSSLPRVDLFEDDDLLLLAANLRMDPELRLHPVSSVVFAYLGNALQLNHSIERRYI